MNFEEALKKLEKIVEELEAGELTLDESLKKFKDGIELTSFCNKKLDDAEKKISILVEDSEGRISEKPFKSNGEEPVE